jgi:1-acyl-sn-glycerol-3-phosphate acyltransferase
MLRQRIGQAIAAGLGWRVVVPADLPAHCVIIGAPHTSGWDLGLTLLLTFVGDLRLHWIAKEELFRGPLGVLLRALGGLPVARKGRGNFVAQMVAAFKADKTMRVAISPEGTRERIATWKTGFYYIALGAGVPIVLGYADYRRKVVGLGPTIQPSGDIQADFVHIRAFYSGMQGRFPDQQGPIEIAAERP